MPGAVSEEMVRKEEGENAGDTPATPSGGAPLRPACCPTRFILHALGHACDYDAAGLQQIAAQRGRPGREHAAALAGAVGVGAATDQHVGFFGVGAVKGLVIWCVIAVESLHAVEA